MDSQDKVWETIYGVARQVATRANRMHRGIVTTDDVYQHLSLWALEHWHKVEQWTAEEVLESQPMFQFGVRSRKSDVRSLDIVEREAGEESSMGDLESLSSVNHFTLNQKRNQLFDGRNWKR